MIVVPALDRAVGLEQEPLAAGAVVGVGVEDLLEGDLAVQLGVQGHEDGAQAAPPVPEPGPSLPFDESPDVQARRERLLQVKRKVAAAARPTPVMPALPEAPARAGESFTSRPRAAWRRVLPGAS